MNGYAMKLQKESILKPQFVQADFFLCKIREFELRYNDKWANWAEFYAAFSSEQADRDNPDFVEWAFLCRAFWSELIELEAKGPPGTSFIDAQKPESDSGFCIVGAADCLIQKNILSL